MICILRVYTEHLVMRQRYLRMDSKAQRWASLVENDEERLEENVAVDLEGAALVGLDPAEAHCESNWLA